MTRTGSQALRAEYCIVGIPYNTAMLSDYGNGRSNYSIYQQCNLHDWLRGSAA